MKKLKNKKKALLLLCSIVVYVIILADFILWNEYFQPTTWYAMLGYGYLLYYCTCFVSVCLFFSVFFFTETSRTVEESDYSDVFNQTAGTITS